MMLDLRGRQFWPLSLSAINHPKRVEQLKPREQMGEVISLLNPCQNYANRYNDHSHDRVQYK